MASDTAAPRAAESTAVAAIWLVGGRLIARSIDLVTLLVLARILGPAEFGAVAVAMTLILIVEAISEMPVSFVLVRAPEVTQSMLDTAFTLSMIRGIGIAVILALLAIPYASFNNDLNLVPLICVLAFAPAIRSLISPAMVHFVRAIDFRREFVLDIVGKLATLVVAVTVAYIAQNYWAIAAGTVAAPVVMAIASYFFAPYFPRLTLKEWNQFSSLLQWNTASQFLAAINWQIDRLLLGRMASREDLGRFSIANDLTAIPYQALVIPVVRPLMAGLSALPDEPVRLGQAYRKTTAAIMMVGAPALIGMAVLSEEIVRLILGPKWSDAAACCAIRIAGDTSGPVSVRNAADPAGICRENPGHGDRRLFFWGHGRIDRTHHMRIRRGVHIYGSGAPTYRPAPNGSTDCPVAASGRLHRDGCVPLTGAAASYDLVEQFNSRPRSYDRGWLGGWALHGIRLYSMALERAA